MTEYRDYRITLYVKPSPFRGLDYDFAHKDYDGPEDRRCGNGASIEDCKRQIDELIDDGEGD